MPSSAKIVLKELQMLLYFTSSNSGVRCMIALCIRILTTQIGFVSTWQSDPLTIEAAMSRSTLFSILMTFFKL